jgi:hypothetical protein
MDLGTASRQLLENGATTGQTGGQDGSGDLVTDAILQARKNLLRDGNPDGTGVASEAVKMGIAGGRLDDDLAWLLAVDDSYQARVTLARNAKCPTTVLAHLALSPARDVLAAITIHDHTAASTLASMRASNHEPVRWGIARHLNTPDSTLVELTFDDTPPVRYDAAASLIERVRTQTSDPGVIDTACAKGIAGVDTAMVSERVRAGGHDNDIDTVVLKLAGDYHGRMDELVHDAALLLAQRS